MLDSPVDPFTERESFRDRGLKRCAICSAVKSVAEFYAHSSTWDRKYPYCTACTLVKVRASQDRNRARWEVEEPFANPALKTCTGCDTALPRSEFRMDPTRADGLFGNCITCTTARGSTRRETRRAHWASAGADPYDDPAPKRCPRCAQTRPRADFSTNPSEPDGLSSYCKGCAAAYVAAREARKLGQWIEYVERSVAWDLAGGICYLCSLPCDPARWDLDHVDPIVNGGEHSYFNTAPTHPSCNRSKSGTPWPNVAFDPAS